MPWYLDNVYELNKEAPYTFYLPSTDVLEKLKVGDLVKLIFVSKNEEEDGFHRERMWVEITEKNEKEFVGELDNNPYRIDLKIGDTISFGIENICDTEYDDPASSDWDFYFDAKVIVSDDVLEKREFNFMLKDNSTAEDDPDWSILSGYESGDYVNNPKNFQIISIGVILNIDDSILNFLEEPPLCAYERNDEGEFYKIEDYDWDAYLNG
ncbi:MULTISPECIES: immunity protein Imm33 domain-containing protein [Bacillus]|uniref:immunity protein Imm33 domain-containing protein n=1 Tax=Bacillus TaxID=1386 RepID=UPI0021D204E8|nr:DUF2185 domain-containing protein [Bacillus mobilis]MCU5197408.1 DUF2185 domain-containing protein [Bacillus mobilis]